LKGFGALDRQSENRKSFIEKEAAWGREEEIIQERKEHAIGTHAVPGGVRGEKRSKGVVGLVQKAEGNFANKRSANGLLINGLRVGKIRKRSRKKKDSTGGGECAYPCSKHFIVLELVKRNHRGRGRAGKVPKQKGM